MNVTEEQPSQQELEDMLLGNVDSRAIDGCEPVEPDGECQHGCPSWLIYLELI